MRLHVRRSAVINLMLSILLLVSPAISWAQEEATSEAETVVPDVLIALYPLGQPDGSRFEATLEPGETAEMAAVLANFGPDPIELRTYSTDVIPMVNGGLLMAEYDSERTGRTLWMDYELEEFTLEPNEVVERPFTISVPEDTAPGQYVNAIGLETVNPINPDDQTAFEQYFRKVVSVYINVPGDLQTDFEIGEPEAYSVATQSNVRIPITNTGQIRVDLVGVVTVTDLDGNVIHEEAVRLAPVYMGQEVETRFGFPSAPPPGDYLISYSFMDMTTELTKESEATAFSIPEVEQGEESAIEFENVLIEANDDPIVFANVSVDVTLRQASLRSTRLTLSVHHNGDLVEDFVLAENLSLSQGTTSVTQRYLPATDWESGTYTFSLKLELTDGDSTGVLLEEEDVATLEVP